MMFLQICEYSSLKIFPINGSLIQKLVNLHNMVMNLLLLKFCLPICKGYIFGKHFKSPYPTTQITQTTKPLALIHTNLCGPWTPLCLMLHYIFSIFIDDYFKYTHIYFLHKKFEALAYFTQYGSKCVTRSQKGHQMLDIINQNQTFIFLITIWNHNNHGKLIVFLSYECQRTQSKNSFNPILSFGFNLGNLKIYIYCIRNNQFCKGISKWLI
jgi:hypothetical protein